MRRRAAYRVFVAIVWLLAVGAGAQNIQPIYSFPQSPAIPFAGLVAGPDGNFYGTTWEGGNNGAGAVIKVAPNGEWSTVYSFSPAVTNRGEFFSNPDGGQPWAVLALGSDGNFYGTTWNGGNGGKGTVFKVTTNGALTPLVLFAGTNGANPEAGLILGPDGNFYGATSGSSSGNGTVFKVTANGILTTLHAFTAGNYDAANGYYTNADGQAPAAGLTLGTNGNLYGACSAGGSGDSGTLFEMTTNGTWTTIYSFSAQNYNEGSSGKPDTNFDGASPVAALTLGPDGNFYGTTEAGGKSGSGTIFVVTPSGALTTLHTFAAGHFVYSGQTDLYTNSDGASPYGSLTLGTNGSFYGTTLSGGSSGMGTLFEITTGGTFTTLLTFTNGNGAGPRGALTLGASGNFYGTTEGGGSSGNGTVFEVTTGGALTTLISFASYNGASPYAGLMLGPNGNFYDTTYQGGSYGAGLETGPDGYGTVFEMTTNGALTTLLSLASTNGANPEAGLALGPDGNFYGTTYSGGSNGFGSVFRLTTNGILKTLVSFAGTNGENPAAALTLGTNGNFYGTTVNGGVNDYGTVFKVSTNGVLSMLHAFGGTSDGENPYGGLALGANGNLFGTSSYGGTGGYGTVFEVTNTGGFAVLYSFTDGTNGACPYAGLTLGLNGNFYGTTAGDDSSTYGTVFEMTPSGVVTCLHSFTGGNDSGSPNGLTLGPDGNFYGTTYGSSDPYSGLSNPWGTVFEVTSNGIFTSLASFSGANGENSKGNLTLGPDGNLYGTTSYGGADGIGEVYRLDLPPEIIQQPASQSVLAGTPVTFSVTLFGTAPYSFQWLSNNIPIHGATNSTLTIPVFAAGDAANYTIIVSNAWGSVTSAVASLAAAPGPLISGIIISAGGTVTVNCQTLSNMTSRVWASTNLALQTAWTPIFTNAASPTFGAWQFIETNGQYPRRYYRLSTP